MQNLIGGIAGSFQRMRHQVVADEGDAGALPPTQASATKSRLPAVAGGCGGGRRVTPTTTAAVAEPGSAAVEMERTLPNGDKYIGEFSGNAPHGYGKYIWVDGCVYEGEWRKGNAAGKGKLSWPSGAVYDGEFKGGRMEGIGTFIGANGETYRGSWIADRRHGLGKKSYANGDFYEGQWRRDLREGQGRYVWRNNNQYVGEWRNGVISGRGVLTLANGNQYDGQWENDAPKRSGVFTWPDCSCYFGNWSKDLNLVAHSDQPVSRQQLTEKNTDASVPCEDVSVCEAAGKHRPGQIVSKGHKSYDLVISLQLGIRYSVGKPSKETMIFRPSDFDPREKFWTRFPPEGSKSTPPHQSADFRWKDYCPAVFRQLRKLFAVDPEDYMKAICGANSITELSSPGKSGSLFFLTQDGRFIIKTLKKCEVKVLIRMLTSYYQHVYKYENSLLTKFYGVHCVKPIGGQKVRFVVMGNLFCSKNGIHRRFDLKGSSHGRTIGMVEEEVDETTTMKDLDLNFVFHLRKPWFKNLMCQIDRDCEFLEGESIMDYSLLVGFRFIDDLSTETGAVSHQESSMDGGGTVIEFLFTESGRWDTTRLIEGREPLVRLGANMPARAEHIFHWNKLEQFPIAGGGGLTMAPQVGKIYKVALYFGIIDILRDYDITKKLEHVYKSLQVDPTSISAVDPKLYSRRFRDFIGKVFVEDD